MLWQGRAKALVLVSIPSALFEPNIIKLCFPRLLRNKWLSHCLQRAPSHRHKTQMLEMV